MTIADLYKQYLEHLFSGKRCEAREMIFAAQDRGIAASKLLKREYRKPWVHPYGA